MPLPQQQQQQQSSSTTHQSSLGCHNNNNQQQPRRHCCCCRWHPSSGGGGGTFLAILLLTHFCAHIGTCLPLPSRFQHFIVPTSADWWTDTSRNKVFAVFESANAANGAEHWQLVLELLFFGNNNRRDGQQQTARTQMPYTRLWNTSWGAEGGARIAVDGMPDCAQEEMMLMKEANVYNIHLEVELLPSSAATPANAIVVRAQNAVKYALPNGAVHSMAGNQMRVSFVRTYYTDDDDGGQMDRRHTMTAHTCQIDYHLEQKETSRFQLPSTTPLPRAQTFSSSKRPAHFVANIPFLPTISALLDNDDDAEKAAAATTAAIPIPLTSTPMPSSSASSIFNDGKYATTPKNWPYQRKRVKVPRRSTKAAQNFLTPNHYVPHQGRNRHQHNSNNVMLQWPTMPTWVAMNKNGRAAANDDGYSGSNSKRDDAAAAAVRTTTAISYIDIIRDRKLYQEVQRSRTSEINSRWSYIFLVFMGCIAVLISMSAAFALIMFVMLQCRPNAKKKAKKQKQKTLTETTTSNVGEEMKNRTQQF